MTARGTRRAERPLSGSGAVRQVTVPLPCPALPYRVPRRVPAEPTAVRGSLRSPCPSPVAAAAASATRERAGHASPAPGLRQTASLCQPDLYGVATGETGSSASTCSRCKRKAGRTSTDGCRSGPAGGHRRHRKRGLAHHRISAASRRRVQGQPCVGAAGCGPGAHGRLPSRACCQGTPNEVTIKESWGFT